MLFLWVRCRVKVSRLQMERLLEVSGLDKTRLDAFDGEHLKDRKK